jgi:hypothetical protein
MTQPSRLSERPGVTFQRRCSVCGSPMWMTRISKYDNGHDLRTFECKVCDHSESLVIEFTHAA